MTQESAATVSLLVSHHFVALSALVVTLVTLKVHLAVAVHLASENRSVAIYIRTLFLPLGHHGITGKVCSTYCKMLYNFLLE